MVATNISSLINGTGDLVGYQPAAPSISLPLGPAGGASYAPGRGVLDAETTSRLKGADLKPDTYRKLLSLA